jgi:membrane-associated phospholipid phosphatase
MEKNKWDAFPSGHTLIVLVLLHYSYRFASRIFLIYLPLVLSLVISTVYLRYHYFVDVVAGAALAPFAVFATSLAIKAWEKHLKRGARSEREGHCSA